VEFSPGRAISAFLPFYPTDYSGHMPVIHSFSLGFSRRRSNPIHGKYDNTGQLENNVAVTKDVVISGIARRPCPHFPLMYKHIINGKYTGWPSKK